ncbi:hypothetical protein L4D76_24525 [Photobacterium sagamiensis]|uniref:hypothetical protein n=1 Tax=Photobacterium sagamiensis TaxID=2910241 RepID=UPI003D0E8DC8
MKNKKISIWFGFGIVLCPIVFAWFTLKKGYSTKAKLISFAWLLATAALSIVAPQNQQTEEPAKIVEQVSAQHQAEQPIT